MLKSSILLLMVACLFAFQSPTTPAGGSAGSVADALATGWMLVDTNGDGTADYVNGKIVVPAHPSAAENAAPADLAARLGFGDTGLTLPIVVNAAVNASDGPRIWVGKDAIPAQFSIELARLIPKLEAEEAGLRVGLQFGCRAPLQHEDRLAIQIARASRTRRAWPAAASKSV